jgi:hypothetical protein
VGANGAKTLGEDNIGTSMEQAKGLRISLDRHPPDQTLWTCLENLNSHLLVESAAPARI